MTLLALVILVVVSVLASITLSRAIIWCGTRIRARILRDVPTWRSVEWNEECPLCDGGHGEFVPEAEAHVFAETYDETWAGAGAASGTSVVYCAGHCPGGCSRGCPVVPG